MELEHFHEYDPSIASLLLQYAFNNNITKWGKSRIGDSEFYI